MLQDGVYSLKPVFSDVAMYPPVCSAMSCDINEATGDCASGYPVVMFTLSASSGRQCITVCSSPSLHRTMAVRRPASMRPFSFSHRLI